MGYYSDVAIAMQKKDYLKLKQAISSLCSAADLIEAAQKKKYKLIKRNM